MVSFLYFFFGQYYFGDLFNWAGFTQNELLRTQYAEKIRLPVVSSRLLSQVLQYSESLFEGRKIQFNIVILNADPVLNHRHFHTKRDRTVKPSLGVGMTKGQKLGSVQTAKV